MTVKGSITEYSSPNPMVRKLLKFLLVHLAALQMVSDRCSSLNVAIPRTIMDLLFLF